METELGTVLFGGEGEILGCQHRIIDEPAVRVVERTHFTVGIVTECRIVDPFRRVVLPDVEHWETFTQRSWREVFVGDLELVPQWRDRRAVVAGRAEDQVAGFDEPTHTVRIDGAQMRLPVEPHLRRFPRSQDRVTSRVAVADNRRRSARRTGTRTRPLVDHDHRTSTARQLQCYRRTDHSRPDHDRIRTFGV